MVILLKMLNELRNYILEEKFEFRFIDNKLDIINYKSINHFDSNKIIINHENGYIVINGNNLNPKISHEIKSFLYYHQDLLNAYDLLKAY